MINPPLVLRDKGGWHRMARMTGPDCAVIMCNLINDIHKYIPTTYIPSVASDQRFS